MTPPLMRPPLYPVYWRLVYEDEVIDEVAHFDGTGASIARRPAGAAALVLADPSGHGLVRIDLPPGQRPVFYRVRSAGVGEAPRLDATVCGYADDAGGKLFMWDEQLGALRDCPLQYIAEAMIRLQVT